jgi:prepilin-type N-terminal cleavage/methylation domain-containing protein
LNLHLENCPDVFVQTSSVRPLDYALTGRDGRPACPLDRERTDGDIRPYQLLVRESAQKTDGRQRGFTLLEILVAVVLLATAFTIIWSTFAATLNGWRRSSEFVDRITHGDFVIDQLVSSLRSTAFFANRPDKFGFWLDSRGGGDSPRDSISWVTSGSAFMRPDDPLANGLHRIMLTVEDAPGGNQTLAVRAFQHMTEEIDKDDVDPWFVSSRVIGLDCRVYNFEDEDWDDEWEDTNAVPSLVEVTVFMEPVGKNESPIEMRRIIEIPVAPAVTGAVVAAGAPGQTPGQDGQPVQPGQQPAQPNQEGQPGQPGQSPEGTQPPGDVNRIQTPGGSP